jgi:hypothetical protein
MQTVSTEGKGRARPRSLSHIVIVVQGVRILGALLPYFDVPRGGERPGFAVRQACAVKEWLLSRKSKESTPPAESAGVAITVCMCLHSRVLPVWAKAGQGRAAGIGREGNGCAQEICDGKAKERLRETGVGGGSWVCEREGRGRGGGGGGGGGGGWGKDKGEK